MRIGFLKERVAALIDVGPGDSLVQYRVGLEWFTARRVEESWAWSRHCVPPHHHVDAARRIRELRVGWSEVEQDVGGEARPAAADEVGACRLDVR